MLCIQIKKLDKTEVTSYEIIYLLSFFNFPSIILVKKNPQCLMFNKK